MIYIFALLVLAVLVSAIGHAAGILFPKSGKLFLAKDGLDLNLFSEFLGVLVELSIIFIVINVIISKSDDNKFSRMRRLIYESLTNDMDEIGRQIILILNNVEKFDDNEWVYHRNKLIKILNDTSLRDNLQYMNIAFTPSIAENVAVYMRMRKDIELSKSHIEMIEYKFKAESVRTLTAVKIVSNHIFSKENTKELSFIKIKNINKKPLFDRILNMYYYLANDFEPSRLTIYIEKILTKRAIKKYGDSDWEARLSFDQGRQQYNDRIIDFRNSISTLASSLAGLHNDEKLPIIDDKDRENFDYWLNWSAKKR